jgi:glycerol-3-phosphate responsive antiterminator
MKEKNTKKNDKRLRFIEHVDVVDEMQNEKEAIQVLRSQSNVQGRQFA